MLISVFPWPPHCPFNSNSYEVPRPFLWFPLSRLFTYPFTNPYVHLYIQPPYNRYLLSLTVWSARTYKILGEYFIFLKTEITLPKSILGLFFFWTLTHVKTKCSVKYCINWPLVVSNPHHFFSFFFTSPKLKFLKSKIQIILLVD